MMKRGGGLPGPRVCTGLIITLHRALVTRVLAEYQPEAARLSEDVFDALQSAVNSLVDEG